MQLADLLVAGAASHTIRQRQAVNQVTANMDSAGPHSSFHHVHPGHLHDFLRMCRQPHPLAELTPGPEVDLRGQPGRHAHQGGGSADGGWYTARMTERGLPPTTLHTLHVTQG